MAETTEHQCQTKGCPNSYVMIMLWAGDSTAQYFCLGCWAAASMQMIMTMQAQGLLPAMDGGGGDAPGPAAPAEPLVPITPGG